VSIRSLKKHDRALGAAQLSQKSPEIHKIMRPDLFPGVVVL
jgi:hypothetical protein